MPVRGLCVLLILFAAIGCARHDENAVLTGPPEGEVLVLDSVSVLKDLVVGSGSNLFVLDDKAGRVWKYRWDGSSLTGFGSLGSGPGELRNPQSLVSLADRVAVVERGGRVQHFGPDGDFLGAFQPWRVIHMNSSAVGYADSLIAVGGLREKAGDQIGGTMLHITSSTGADHGNHSPVSELSRENEVDILFGMHCDADSSGELVCVQLTDYALLTYGPRGEERGRVPVQSQRFRPLNQKQPEEQSDRIEWIQSFDGASCVFVVDDTYAVACHGRGQERVLELVRRSDGVVLKTRTGMRKLLHYDRSADAYFLDTDQDAEEVEMRILRVAGADMWGGG